MGNTLSSNRLEFLTPHRPMDLRPYLVVERRDFTLHYGVSFADYNDARRYVDAVERPEKRVAVERGDAAWVGQALEKVNPGSHCLAQERARYPQHFLQAADGVQAGVSIGLLDFEGLVALHAQNRRRQEAQTARLQAEMLALPPPPPTA